MCPELCAIRPGQIYSLREEPDSFGLTRAPLVLVLSTPEETPCGLHAVTTVPLYTGGVPQIIDLDLALFHPFVPVEWEPVVAQFSALQSLLAGHLGDCVAELHPSARPLLSAMWKKVSGIGSGPAGLDIQPSLAWETGFPIPQDPATGQPNARDARLVRLFGIQASLRPFAQALDLALHDQGLVRILAGMRSRGISEHGLADFCMAYIDADPWRIVAAASTDAPVLDAADHERELNTTEDPLRRLIHSVHTGKDELLERELDQWLAQCKSWCLNSAGEPAGIGTDTPRQVTEPGTSKDRAIGLALGFANKAISAWQSGKPLNKDAAVGLVAAFARVALQAWQPEKVLGLAKMASDLTMKDVYELAKAAYSDEGFHRKVTEFGRAIGREILEKAFVLFLCLKTRGIGLREKGISLMALGYLIMPLDLLPDMLPAGYSDDMGVLALAIGALGSAAAGKIDFTRLQQQAKDRVTELLETE